MSELRTTVLRMQQELLDAGFAECKVWRVSEQTWALETDNLLFDGDRGVCVRLFAYAGSPVLFASMSNPAPKAGMSLHDMLANIKHVLTNQTTQGLPYVLD